MGCFSTVGFIDKRMAERYGQRPGTQASEKEIDQWTRDASFKGDVSLTDINADRAIWGLAPISEDPVKAAERTTASQNAAAEKTTSANRPNITTPWGNFDWTKNADGTWGLSVGLTSEQQQALDAQQKLQQGRSEFAQSLLGGAEKAFSSPLDYGALPGLPDAEATRSQAIDASFNQARSRLDPMWGQRGDALKASLLNSGFSEGDAGYKNAMGEFERDRDDAYNSAMNSAIGSGAQAAQQMFGMGMGQRQQALSEAIQQRDMPLNELNAMLNGQQVGMPSQPGVSQATQLQGTNYSGAANTAYQNAFDAYSLQQAQQQAQMNGWMSLLGGIMGMAGKASGI